MHCRNTEEHAGSTSIVQVYGHIAENSSNYRKAIAVSHATWSCATRIHSCLFGIRRAAQGCSRLPQILCAPCCSQMQERHRSYCQKDLACRLKKPPSFAPECLHAGSNSACKISQNLNTTSISSGTRPNNM